MTKRVESVNWLAEGMSSEELEVEKALALIGAQIKMQRTMKLMTQQDLADKLGITQGCVSRYESGSYNFTITNLIHVCDALDLQLKIPLMEDK